MIFDRLRRLESSNVQLVAQMTENTRITRDVVRQTEAIAGQMHDLSLNGERAAIKKLAEHADAIVDVVDTMASIRKAIWYLVGATVTALLGAGAYWVVVVAVAHH